MRPEMLLIPRALKISAFKGQVKLMSWSKETGMGTDRMLILASTLRMSCDESSATILSQQGKRANTHIELL